MKLAHVLSIAALSLAPLAHAQHDSMKGMDMNHGHGEAAAESHHASGVVKSVDAAKGTVTIAHGAIESLKWPAMTMSFKARDKKLLDTLKPGQKIDFDLVQEGKAYVLTRVQ